MKQLDFRLRVLINLIIFLFVLFNTLVMLNHYSQLKKNEKYLKEIITLLNEPIETVVEFEDEN